ncbi:MAG: stage II sporulation protein M [Methanobacteriaceae archaeon]|nr:stage II sporulation protein M [Methanobacteriaceae archaeon]
MNIKEEIISFYHRNKYHVLLSLLIFFTFTLLSYFFPSFFVSLAMPTIQGMQEGAKAGTLVLSTASLFINNYGVALMMYKGGILLSIPTMYLLVYNGIIIGVTGAQLPITYYLAYILPHGIFEITAIIIAGGAGFRLTHAIITVLSGIKLNDENSSEIFFNHLHLALKIFIDSAIMIIALAVLLLIAAFVEANLSIPIGKMFVNMISTA